MTLWTSRTRTATASKSTNGVGRRGYGLPLSWREDFEVLGLSCAVARRIQTATLTWTWMGTTHLNTGNHSTQEADVIPCTGEEPGEAKEREALRGAVLNGGTPSTRITPEFSKWASDEMPSTSNGESSKQETMQKTCKNSDIEKITEDSAVTTFEALKARVRELERQLSRGDRYKCLICMVSSTPVVVMNQKCFGISAEEGKAFSFLFFFGGWENSPSSLYTKESLFPFEYRCQVVSNCLFPYVLDGSSVL
uniref:Uncharacterized protein n=1 Tax=Anas platyrhynchos TaxID=8839 RepID=A0A8B9TSU3_ANAPL